MADTPVPAAPVAPQQLLGANPNAVPNKTRAEFSPRQWTADQEKEMKDLEDKINSELQGTVPAPVAPAQAVVPAPPAPVLQPPAQVQPPVVSSPEIL